MATWHEDILDEAAAYLTGELQGAARTAFERHLDRCPACRQEVVRLQDTLAALATDTPLGEPPARLRDAVLGAAAREGGRAGRPRWTAATVLSTAVLAACCAGLGVELVAAHQANAGLLAANRELEARLREARPAQAVTVLPLRATPAAGAAATGAVTVVAGARGDTVVLVAAGLPPPQGDQVYQLWYIRDGTPVSAGPLAYSDGAARFRSAVPAGLSVTAVAVSREPRPGDTRPEGPIVLQS